MWLVVSKFGVACFLHACMTFLLSLLARLVMVLHDAADTLGIAEKPFGIVRGRSPLSKRKLC